MATGIIICDDEIGNPNIKKHIDVENNIEILESKKQLIIGRFFIISEKDADKIIVHINKIINSDINYDNYQIYIHRQGKKNIDIYVKEKIRNKKVSFQKGYSHIGGNNVWEEVKTLLAINKPKIVRKEELIKEVKKEHKELYNIIKYLIEEKNNIIMINYNQICPCFDNKSELKKQITELNFPNIDENQIKKLIEFFGEKFNFLQKNFSIYLYDNEVKNEGFIKKQIFPEKQIEIKDYLIENDNEKKYLFFHNTLRPEICKIYEDTKDKIKGILYFLPFSHIDGDKIYRIYCDIKDKIEKKDLNKDDIKENLNEILFKNSDYIEEIDEKFKKNFKDIKLSYTRHQIYNYLAPFIIDLQTLIENPSKLNDILSTKKIKDNDNQEKTIETKTDLKKYIKDIIEKCYNELNKIRAIKGEKVYNLLDIINRMENKVLNAFKYEVGAEKINGFDENRARICLAWYARIEEELKMISEDNKRRRAGYILNKEIKDEYNKEIKDE